MIGLLKHHIAVDPIFDPSVIEKENALSREEKEFLASQGIPTDKAIDIQLPESTIKKCDQGIIKYVGKGVEEDFDLHIGDWVLFSGYTGTTLRLDGEGLLIIMKADAVTAIAYPPTTDIPGLYFTDGEQFFTATHEMAIQLIRQTFEEAQLFKTRPVKG